MCTIIGGKIQCIADGGEAGGVAVIGYIAAVRPRVDVCYSRCGTPIEFPQLNTRAAVIGGKIQCIAYCCEMGRVAAIRVAAVVIARITGRMDSATSPSAQEKLLSIVKDNVKMALDMSACEFVSSAGLRTLLLVANRSIWA